MISQPTTDQKMNVKIVPKFIMVQSEGVSNDWGEVEGEGESRKG